MDTGIPATQGLSFYEQGMPSGVNDAFSGFLGPAPRAQATNPYDKQNVSVFSMPENYVGKNLFLRDTVMDYMFTAQSTQLTERIMPWYVTDDLFIQWQQWETNAHAMEVTPHQSLSKRIPQSRNIRRSSLVRRGIMFEFEHDFVRTALGQLSFIKGLGQIARSLQETANVEIVRALVQAHRFQQQFQREHGVFRKGNLKEVLELDRDRFGLVQKDQTGLESWTAQVKAEMWAWRGQANAILMSEEISIYCTFVGPVRTHYDKAGPRGPARINNDPSARFQAASGTQGSLSSVQPEAMVRQTPVFFARSHAVDGKGRQELLTRIRAVGEYVQMNDECPPDVPYQSSSREVSIFDEDADDFGKLTIDMGIDNLHIWDTNGNVWRNLISLNNVYGVDEDKMNPLQKRDLGRNFLARPDPDNAGKFLPIQYIGDIAEEFLSDESLMSCAESLAAAIFRGDIQARNEAERAMSDVLGAAEAPDAVAVAIDRVAKRLDQLAGKGRLFSAENGAGLVSNFMTAGTMTAIVEDDALGTTVAPVQQKDKDGTPIMRIPAQEEASLAINSQINDATDVMLQTLITPLAKLGKRYATPAHEIARNTDMSAEERAHAIREHINSVVEQQVPGFYFKNRAAVTDNYEKCLSSYKNHVASLQSQAAPAPQQRQRQPRARAQAQAQERMHRVGDPMPAGYRYKNQWVAQNVAQIANESQNAYGYIKPSMFQMTQFASKLHDQKEKEMQQGRSREGAGAYYAGGQSAGTFERVGQFNFGEMGSTNDVVARIRERSTAAPGSTPFLKRFSNMDKRIKNIADGSGSALLQVCALFYLGSTFNRFTFKAFRRNDIRIPFNLLITRPQATYRTRTIVKCQSDGGCGNMFFGHSEAKIGHDNPRGLGLLHYTAYMAAVVTDPRNVYVQHDVMMAGYLGGLNLRFFSPQSYQAFVKSNQRAPKESICCFILPYEEKTMPLYFDISGRFYTEMRGQLADQRQGGELAFSTAPMHNFQYKFYNPMTAGNMQDQPTSRRRKHVNRIVWRGCQYNKNPITGLFDKYRANQGHLGPTYPKCGQVRAGKLQYLDSNKVLTSTGN